MFPDFGVIAEISQVSAANYTKGYVRSITKQILPGSINSLRKTKS
jgi:hypothetical protein